MLSYNMDCLDLEKSWTEPPIYSSKPLDLEAEGLDQLHHKLLELQNVLSEFRQQVRKHIIENEEVNPFDFIQHRAGLLLLLSRLDQMFLTAAQLPRSTEAEQKGLLTLLAQLDKIQAPLYQELIEWHGRPEDQSDIPLDLINAFRDAVSGRTVDMETALHASPEVS